MKKTILLLGGFGFIGSNLLDYIDLHISDLFDVIVFDKFSHHPKNFIFNCINKNYAGDFSDDFVIETIFKENNIDVVIHALNTTVPATSANMRFDIESNIIPTLRLLDLMVIYGVKNIIYISSGGAIYGNKDFSLKHKEDDVAYPISSYGIVKLMIEKYLYQYSYLHDLKVTILRLSNPYGKYHYSDKQGVINVAVRSAFCTTPFCVWGDGSAEKDYIYVDDFCEILFRLIDMNEKYLLLNIGSGYVVSVNQLLYSIKELIPSFEWNYVKQVRTDVQRFELDITRLFSLIGPYKFTDIFNGLKKTVKWLEQRETK